MNPILNRNTIRAMIVLTAAVLLINCGPKDESPDKKITRGDAGALLEASLTPIIEEVMQAYDLPGFAIGVVKR